MAIRDNKQCIADLNDLTITPMHNINKCYTAQMLIGRDD
jgi:hypothetical protein